MRLISIFVTAAFLWNIGCATTTPQAKSEAKSAAKADTAKTTDKSEAVSGEMICQKKQETRKLRIEALQPKGCNLWYSTHGDKDPVATSKHSNEHCQEVQNKIQKKLESAGFKCS